MGQPTTDAIGATYEKFVAKKLGLVLSSDRYTQITSGDTECGTEIKFDRRLNETGNLWVEYAECRIPGNKMVASSILKPHCKLFVIGDCSRLLVFDVAVLRRLLKQLRQRQKEGQPTERDANTPVRLVRTRTSRAMLGRYEWFSKYATTSEQWPENDHQPLMCEDTLYATSA